MFDDIINEKKNCFVCKKVIDYIPKSVQPSKIILCSADCFFKLDNKYKKIGENFTIIGDVTTEDIDKMIDEIYKNNKVN